MPRLTKTVAENASYPRRKGASGFHVVWDNLVPGFGLRCNPGGSKTYVCAYRHRGRKRMIKLARHPVVTPQQARDMAREVLVEVIKGTDPLEERQKEEKRGTTLAQLWERYLRDYAEPHYKPQTLRESKGAWSRYLEKPLGGRCLPDITRNEVAKLQASLYAESGPYAANDAIRLLRRLLAQAIQWGLLPQGQNPAKGLRRTRRSRGSAT